MAPGREVLGGAGRLGVLVAEALVMAAASMCTWRLAPRRCTAGGLSSRLAPSRTCRSEGQGGADGESIGPDEFVGACSYGLMSPPLLCEDGMAVEMLTLLSISRQRAANSKSEQWGTGIGGGRQPAARTWSSSQAAWYT